MIIREATSSDLSTITTIANQSFFGQSPWPQAVFEHEINSPRSSVYVAKTDHLVGFISVTDVLDERSINSLAVLPDDQGQHFGQQLLAYIEKSPQIKRLLLEVAVDNLPAYALYQKVGYQQIAIRKNYYHRGLAAVDAIIMEKING